MKQNMQNKLGIVLAMSVEQHPNNIQLYLHNGVNIEMIERMGCSQNGTPRKVNQGLPFG